MSIEIETRDREALAVAIGSLRLEGIEPDAAALADMERVITGQVTTNEVIKTILERARREQIQQHG